ncbi:PAS domain-containing protein [Novosphingobium sp. ZW T3_23]|uniref:PAS domain-containing protein n=1 Tax=Novosphingobium sp. ZW T3_23 TaxID=3378084 RepID=UPI003852311A
MLPPLWGSNLWVCRLELEYVSPAVAAIYGVEPEAFLGDIEKWAATIVPEDRSTAFEHIEQARHGDAVVHEFRNQRPSDSTFR